MLVLAVASAILGAGVVAAVGFVWGGDSGSKSASPAAVTSSQQNNGGSSSSTNLTQPSATDFSQLYDGVKASIVEIKTTASGGRFSGQSSGLGSGIVLDTDGHILTNNHVINGFTTATVTFSDGATGQATVMGTDPADDIAIIKVSVDSSELHPVKLGDSSQMQVGNVVFAVGNPFGLDWSLSTGVISGLDRTLPSSSGGRSLAGLLQTDAAVNPGNSGGALFNMNGEVIGINTAIENPSGDTFAGVAYAVPINTPKRFLDQLIGGATIDHPRLGISGQTLSAADAKTAGVDYGVTVASVSSGSPAANAGLRGATDGSGDIITAIDGNATKKFEDLANYIDTKQVGDEVTLTVHRDGKDVQITAKLESWGNASSG